MPGLDDQQDGRSKLTIRRNISTLLPAIVRWAPLLPNRRGVTAFVGIKAVLDSNSKAHRPLLLARICMTPELKVQRAWGGKKGETLFNIMAKANYLIFSRADYRQDNISHAQVAALAPY